MDHPPGGIFWEFFVMFVKNDTLVRISVDLYDMQGNLLESTAEDGITYYHGHGDIFDGLERALTGKAVGQSVSVILEPRDAFGDFDDMAIELVDVETLGDPLDIYPGLLFEKIPGRVPDGKTYRVTEIADGKAVLDANHPYAGYTLRFEVKILGIEEPEEDVSGNDSIVVPSFLTLADRLVDESD